MLLSLVIVAVEITSFTVACFSLVALLCFFSSIKKKITTKKKQKTLDKEGDKISLWPPRLLIVPGAVLSPTPPSLLYDFSPDTEVGGAGGVCRFVKRRNQVFAQFVRPFSSGTAASKIRKVLFLEIVLVEKIITLFRMLSTTFFPPLPSFQPISPQILPISNLPQPPPLKCC